jgi:hypothetical protein
MGMYGEIYLSKGLVAAEVCALVRLLPCMYSQVLLQGRVLRERLSTSDDGTKE